MNIYLIIQILFFILFILEYNKVVTPKKCYNIGCFFFLGLFMLRGENVGGDTLQYCYYYQGKASMYDNLDDILTESGFPVFCKLLNIVSHNQYFFIAMISFITLCPYLYLVRKYSNNKSMAFFLFMSIWTLMGAYMTALRQVLSISFIIYAYILYHQKISSKIKIRGCLLLLAFAFLSHNSALYAIPLFIIIYLSKMKRKVALILLFSSWVIIYITKDVFSIIYNSLEAVMSQMDLASRFLNYDPSSSYAVSQDISPWSLLPVTVLMMIFTYLSDEEELNSMPAKCMVFGTAFFNIGASFPMTFRVLMIILIFALSYTPKSFLKKINPLLCSIIVVIMIYMIQSKYTFYTVFERAIRDGEKTIPYLFFWE